MTFFVLNNMRPLPLKVMAMILFVLLGLGHYTPVPGQTSKPGCQNPAFDKEVQRMLRFSIPTLDVSMLHAGPEAYTILDAREMEEFQVSHISGAHWIGFDHFHPKNLPEMQVNTPILVYCSIGYRSEKIAVRLKALGYLNVVNLYGSIFEWANRGYPLVDRLGKPTQALHTYNRRWSKWVDNPAIRKTW